MQRKSERKLLFLQNDENALTTLLHSTDKLATYHTIRCIALLGTKCKLLYKCSVVLFESLFLITLNRNIFY